MVSISVINTHVQFRIRLFTLRTRTKLQQTKRKKNTELTNANRKLSKKLYLKVQHMTKILTTKRLIYTNKK